MLLAGLDPLFPILARNPTRPQQPLQANNDTEMRLRPQLRNSHNAGRNSAREELFTSVPGRALVATRPL